MERKIERREGDRERGREGDREIKRGRQEGKNKIRLLVQNKF